MLATTSAVNQAQPVNRPVIDPLTAARIQHDVRLQLAAQGRPMTGQTIILAKLKTNLR